MRRLGDLDSNSWIAARPYCNGRATASDKVLKRSKPIICGREEKMSRRAKASVVGFHCPVCGTGATRKFHIPNPKTQTRSKSQISKKTSAAKFGIQDLRFVCDLELGIWDFLTSVTEVRPHTPAPRGSPASTIHRAPRQFAGSTQDRFPIHRVLS